jgi:hypothetical protein
MLGVAGHTCSSRASASGASTAGRLGLRHHQLRLVDRHRPRRHADLGHSAAAPAGLAHVDQPLRRSDDALCRGLRRDLPIFHTGRPWLAAYWLLPYPNTMGMWPKFRSPLIWDVFAVSTYATVSALFWYVGLIPDLATMRDRRRATRSKRRSTACSRWAGAARRGTGSATRWPTCCWPALDAAGALGAHGRELRLRGRHHPGLARDDLPAVLRRGRDLCRLRDGADAGHSAAKSTPSKTSSRCATSRTWRRSRS